MHRLCTCCNCIPIAHCMHTGYMYIHVQYIHTYIKCQCHCLASRSAIRHQTRPPTLVRTSINSSCTQLQLTQQEVHTAIVRRQRAMGVLLNPLVVATLAVMMSATWTLTAGRLVVAIALHKCTYVQRLQRHVQYELC